VWRELADYQRVLREDVRRQSNSLDRVSAAAETNATVADETITDQEEARALTDLFLQRLPPPLPADAEKLTPQPTPDGSPPADPTETGLTVEARSNVVDLAQQTIAVQDSALRMLRSGALQSAQEDQRHAMELLRQIEELMPRSKNQQKQDQPQQDEQNQKDQQEQQDQQDQQQEQPPEQKPPEQQEQQQPQQQEPVEMTPEQVQKLLEDAAQREQEYEELKRRQNQMIPMSPRERDW